MRTATAALFSLAVIGLSGSATAAEPDAYHRGYADCTPRRLEACESSNQLVWGMSEGLQQTPVRKPEFKKGLYRFLRGAPRIRLLKYSWSAAETALDSFTGPGEKPTRFQNGDWFIYGFRPHEASAMAAIIFDPKGKILAVATLSTGDDVASAKDYDGSQHVLTVYARGRDPSAHDIQYLRAWARRSIAGMGGYPDPSQNRFAGMRLLVAADQSDHWRGRWID